MQVNQVPPDGSLQDIGLGRAMVNQHGVTRAADPSISATPLVSSESAPNELRSILRALRHSTASGIRNILNNSKESVVDESSSAPVLAGSPNDTSASRLKHIMPTPHKMTMEDMVHHPIDAIKQKSASLGSRQVVTNIAVSEMSHGQEVDLIHAQDKVEFADNDEASRVAIENRDKMINERQATYVRWTMDRHITKCRNVRTAVLPERPRSSFVSKNAQGEDVTDYQAYATYTINRHVQQYGGKYIGYGSEPPPLSMESMMPIVERAIIASTPLQQTMMTLRNICHWEDRLLTSTCLATYLALWYYNLLLPGMLLVVVCLVVRRRTLGDTIHGIRQHIERVEDRDSTSLSLSELIGKEGNELWSEELLELISPWAMVQICDAADMLEIMRNFYEWRAPNRTLVTLAGLIIAIPLTALLPAWLLLKLGLLVAGFVFFVSFPLASKYPKYRLLVSFPRRLFWNIPTHGQWAIGTLQAEAVQHQQTSQPSGEYLAAVDYNSYTANYGGRNGSLVISALDARFVTNSGQTVLWMLQYGEMSTVEKVNRRSKKNVAGLSTSAKTDLRIVSNLGEECLFKHMETRDLAFTQLLGFSNQPWQIVW